MHNSPWRKQNWEWSWPTGIGGLDFNNPFPPYEGQQRNPNGWYNTEPSTFNQQPRFEESNSLRKLYQEKNPISKPKSRPKLLERRKLWAREEENYQDSNQPTSDDVLGRNAKNNSERITLADMNEFEYEGENTPEHNYDEVYVRAVRSPIKQLYRNCVEEDNPKRNFGDYDPVKPTSHTSADVRTSLPLKLQKRRVIYKLVSEQDIEVRRMSQQEPVRYAKLNKTYDERLANSRSPPDKYHPVIHDHVSDTLRSSPNGSDVEKSSYSYSRTNLHQETIVSSNTADETDLEDSVGEQLSTNHSEYAPIYMDNFEKKHKMFAEHWYDKQTVKPDVQAFLGTPKGCPEWGLSREGKPSRNNISDDEYDEGAKAGRPVTAKAIGQPSSWIDYIQGTEFYQSFAETQNPRADKSYCGNNVNNSPLGYQSTQGISDVRSYDSRFELGRNENQFTDQIYKLNYFYQLKMRPTDKKHGIEYFGYELEFWPNDAPDIREVVFGYQMDDQLKAKDSVFAAGLMKLISNKTRNEGIIRQREKVNKCGAILNESTRYYNSRTSSENDNNVPSLMSVNTGFPPTKLPGTMEDFVHTAKTFTPSSSYTSTAPVSREPNPRPTAEIRRENSGNQSQDRKDSTRYYGEHKRENFSNENAGNQPQDRKDSTRYYGEHKRETFSNEPESEGVYGEEKDEERPYQSTSSNPGPSKKSDRDEDFRVAIQRCPSIIWDTRRKGSVEREGQRTSRFRK